MKKFLNITLAAALLVLLLSSCSERKNVEDKTRMISFGSFSRAVISSNTIPFSDDLYWFYTAEKKDGGFNTGETLSQIPVDKSLSKGYINKSVGPFSYGGWTFTLYGYADLKKDDKDNPKAEGKDLIYSGSKVEVINAESNVISVTVKYENKKGEDGYLTGSDITFITSSTSGDISKASMKVRPDGSESVVYEADLEKTEGKFGFERVALEDGVYVVSFTLYDNTEAQNIVGRVDGKYVLILSGRNTVLSGTITEETDYVGFEIAVNQPGEGEYEEINGKYFVSNIQQLKNALNDSSNSKKNIVLTSNITSKEEISVSGDVTINLNNNGLFYSGNASLFALNPDSSFGLQNGSAIYTGSSPASSLVGMTDGGKVSLDSVTVEAFSSGIDSGLHTKDDFTSKVDITLKSSTFKSMKKVVSSEKTGNLTVTACRFLDIDYAAIYLNQCLDGGSVNIRSSEFMDSGKSIGSIFISIRTSEDNASFEDGRNQAVSGFSSVEINGCTFAGEGRKFVVLGSNEGMANPSSITDALASGFILADTEFLVGADESDVFEDGTGSSSVYKYNKETGKIGR